MPRYAQVDMITGFVISDSNLGEIDLLENPNMIPLTDDFDLYNKKWDFTEKTWVDYVPKMTPIEELETSQPTNTDIIENQYAIMMAIADLYEMNM